ncbi:MAG: cyclic lactone autoinducer peptide [Eubacterium sp.]
MKQKKVVEKIISKAAYNSAKANVNSNCTWFCYQPKTPEKLKNLEIFND